MKLLRKFLFLAVFFLMVMSTSVSVHAAIKLNNGKTAVVTQGKKITIKVSGTSKKVTKWKSSDEKIATVTQKGVVKGIKAGKTCTIKAKIGTKVYSCKVSVKANKFVCTNQDPATWTIRASNVTFNPLKAYYKNGGFVCEGFWQNPTNLSYRKIFSNVTVYAVNGSTTKQIASANFVTTFGDLVVLQPNQWVKQKLTFYPDQVGSKSIDLRKCDLRVVTTIS